MLTSFLFLLMMNLEGDALESSAAQVETVIVPSGSAWAYYAADGTPQGKWRQGDGSEGWKPGPTPIGWGDDDIATTFTSDSRASERFPVAHFRRHVQISAEDRIRELNLAVNCDDGCIVWFNGHEVGRARMPRGLPRRYTAGVAAMRQSDTFQIPRKLLKPYNVIAVAVYQSHPSSSDMRFDAELTAR